jgi:F1F0 ATPase subunit 2
MDDLGPLVLASVGGLLLGILYFGDLWMTVRRLPTTPFPALFILGSFVGRIGLFLGGLYWLTAGQAPCALACLGGILVARQGLIRLWRPEPRVSHQTGKVREKPRESAKRAADDDES